MASENNIFLNYQYKRTEYCASKSPVIEKTNIDDSIKYVLNKEKCDRTKIDDSIGYCLYREGSKGGFDAVKEVDDIDVKNIIHEKQPGYVGQVVVSFFPEFLEEHNLLSKKNMMDFIRKGMNKWLVDCDLNPNDFYWYAGYHRNTDNPHCHVQIFNIQNPQEKLWFNKKLLSKGRSAFANIIDRAVDLYKTRDIQKKKIEKEIINKFDFKNEELKKSILNARIENDNLKFKPFYNEKEIINKFLSIKQKIPKEGRTSLNSVHMKELKNEILELTDLILEDDSIKSMLEDYERILKDIVKSDIEMYGTKSVTQNTGDLTNAKNYQNKIRELKVSISNKLIKAMKNVDQREVELIKDAINKSDLKEEKKEQVNELVKSEILNSIDNRICQDIKKVELTDFEAMELLPEKIEYIEYLNDIKTNNQKLYNKYKNYCYTDYKIIKSLINIDELKSRDTFINEAKYHLNNIELSLNEILNIKNNPILKLRLNQLSIVKDSRNYPNNVDDFQILLNDKTLDTLNIDTNKKRFGFFSFTDNEIKEIQTDLEKRKILINLQGLEGKDPKFYYELKETLKINDYELIDKIQKNNLSTILEDIDNSTINKFYNCNLLNKEYFELVLLNSGIKEIVDFGKFKKESRVDYFKEYHKSKLNDYEYIKQRNPNNTIRKTYLGCSLTDAEYYDLHNKNQINNMCSLSEIKSLDPKLYKEISNNFELSDYEIINNNLDIDLLEKYSINRNKILGCDVDKNQYNYLKNKAKDVKMLHNFMLEIEYRKKANPDGYKKCNKTDFELIDNYLTKINDSNKSAEEKEIKVEIINTLNDNSDNVNINEKFSENNEYMRCAKHVNNLNTRIKKNITNDILSVLDNSANDISAREMLAKAKEEIYKNNINKNVIYK